MDATFGAVGWGVNATYDTLHQMRGLVLETYGLPVVRQTAVNIAAGNGVNSEKQARLIRRWLQRRVRFLRDPYRLEGLHRPDLLLSEIIPARGYADVDCDDVAMLGAALGMAVGLPARLVAVGPADSFSHVFAELSDPSGGPWWELDIQRPASGFPADFTDLLILEV